MSKTKEELHLIRECSATKRLVGYACILSFMIGNSYGIYQERKAYSSNKHHDIKILPHNINEHAPVAKPNNDYKYSTKP